MLEIRVYPTQFTSFNEGENHKLTWDQFCEMLSEPVVVSSKGQEPQFFPGRMLPEATSKGDKSVEKVFLYCIDADSIDETVFNDLIRTIENEKVEAFMYSTFSHAAQRKKNGLYRIRIVFPLSRPLSADEFRLFWPNSRLTFCNVADPTTSGPGKHYLFPSVPEGKKDLEIISRRFKGEFLNVSKMMSRYGLHNLANAEVETTAIGREPVSKEQFLAAIKNPRKKTDKPTLDALKKAADDKKKNRVVDETVEKSIDTDESLELDLNLDSDTEEAPTDEDFPEVDETATPQASILNPTGDRLSAELAGKNEHIKSDII